jgi:hypothetical protein
VISSRGWLRWRHWLPKLGRKQAFDGVGDNALAALAAPVVAGTHAGGWWYKPLIDHSTGDIGGSLIEF